MRSVALLNVELGNADRAVQLAEDMHHDFDKNTVYSALTKRALKEGKHQDALNYATKMTNAPLIAETIVAASKAGGLETEIETVYSTALARPQCFNDHDRALLHIAALSGRI